jgi:DNA-binding NtrC family response regulator
MRTTAVLVIAANEQSPCVQTLDEMGFIPLVRGDMQGALDTVRREPFAAVCIDGGCERIDVLECVLNIRDVDGQTPVLVIHGNNSRHFARLLARQSNTYLVRECAELADALDRLLGEELER